MPPEEETGDRDKKREEQKFKRQAERRSESDPDEPASAEVDEGHSRADPRFIIAHVTTVNLVNSDLLKKRVMWQS